MNYTYLHRVAEASIISYLKIFPAIAITGPRQSGKSTLLKTIFKDKYRYITFDDPLIIEQFVTDPKGFMKEYSNQVIFDEVQKVPQIFNYIKMEIDNDRNKYGKYILTGSSQFAFIKEITETLAGRIGMLSLLPFQIKEIPKKIQKNQIIKGSYPELIKRDYYKSEEWYAAYINNYIERDVRTLSNVGNLKDFQRLMSLLAARSSQELNFSNLASDIGVNVKTIQHWISILEASYIIFTVPPYHKNLGKRIVKRSKLYFYDTGVICYLTGIRENEILKKGPLNGPIFENYIISEIKKGLLHSNADANIYYYRTNMGIEVDLIIEDLKQRKRDYLEIKSTATAHTKMIENIIKVMALEEFEKDIIKFKKEGTLIFTGTDYDLRRENICSKNYLTFLDEKFK